MEYPLKKFIDREHVKGLENCEVIKYEILKKFMTKFVHKKNIRSN